VRPRGLAGRFERLRAIAGVPDAALHRLRHTVAVVLVAEGKLLAAQHRLGHRDLSTTLRHFGWAQDPDDVDVADHLDMVLSGIDQYADTGISGSAAAGRRSRESLVASIVVALRAVVSPGRQAATLESASQIRTGKDRCARVARRVPCRRARRGRRASREPRWGTPCGACSSTQKVTSLSRSIVRPPCELATVRSA
jgi:hypothetical protein